VARAIRERLDGRYSFRAPATDSQTAHCTFIRRRDPQRHGSWWFDSGRSDGGERIATRLPMPRSYDINVRAHHTSSRTCRHEHNFHLRWRGRAWKNLQQSSPGFPQLSIQLSRTIIPRHYCEAANALISNNAGRLG